VGSLICFFGLGSGVLTVLYKAFFGNHVVTFLLFLAIFIGAGSIIIGIFINQVPTPFSDAVQGLSSSKLCLIQRILPRTLPALKRDVHSRKWVS
jgi:hypothetical protein